MTTANLHAPLGAVAVLRTVDSVLNLKENLIQWNENRITRKALSRLTDAQLDDIGLTRDDVTSL